MITFTCPVCGVERTAQRRRCYVCTKHHQTPEVRERIRQGLLGKKHSEERNTANRESHLRSPKRLVPNDGQFTKGSAAYNRLPVGSVVFNTNKERMMVKGADGKWRYRARVVWADAHGPIARGLFIHHINEDKTDDRLENLQALTNSDHMALHGRTSAQSPARRAKLSASIKRAWAERKALVD